MAICNLFKKLTKETGNFLMFSQYTDDLTKWLVRHNDAKVVPSRFIALDLDYSKLNSIDLGLESELSSKFPNLLQNYYENACAFIKSQEIEHFEWTPETSRNIFWNLFRNYLMTFEPWSSESTSGDFTGLVYSPEIVYRNEINLQSFTEEDNIGYNELYCYIPNDAQKTKYCLRLEQEVLDVPYPLDYVEGYNENDADFEGLLSISIPEGTRYQYNEGLTFYDSNGEDLESSFYDEPDSLFKFNTIVVLYDIYSTSGESDELIYKDIPLGLYITGIINNDGTVSNEVTKYVSNGDIYGAGTSYGLRVATRFVATPNATYINEIVVDGEANYADFSKAMSSFSESQERMNSLLDQVTKNNLEVKNQLSSFKNYRANIPYIVKIGDKNYWFVNGKNTNATVSGTVGPQGVTGERGPAGPGGVGPQGVTGPKGEDGLPGVTGAAFTYDMFTPTQLEGLRGPQGVTGARGLQGRAGSRGATGPSGDRGTGLEFNWQGTELGIRQEGSEEYSYTDLQGIQGITGEVGPQGVTGERGEQGVTGPHGGIIEYVAGRNVSLDYDPLNDVYEINVDSDISGNRYDTLQDSISEGLIEIIDSDDSSNDGNSSMNVALGIRSHAEGIGTQALHKAEHAQGKYNRSNSETIQSIGIGTSNMRKNAVEVLNSGEVYVIGIGGYDGTNIESSQSIQQVINGMLEIIQNR